MQLTILFPDALPDSVDLKGQSGHLFLPAFPVRTELSYIPSYPAWFRLLQSDSPENHRLGLNQKRYKAFGLFVADSTSYLLDSLYHRLKVQHGKHIVYRAHQCDFAPAGLPGRVVFRNKRPASGYRYQLLLRL